MNSFFTADFAAALSAELRSFLAHCEDVLTLVLRENQALCGRLEYQPGEFSHRRKDLLPKLEQALINLRSQRAVWQRSSQAERGRCEEVKSLFQSIQGILMKVLLFDHENQQAMLRRGLVPAQHLPPAAVQQPHHVARLYQRNSTL
jgi:hypothetical protein